MEGQLRFIQDMVDCMWGMEIRLVDDTREGRGRLSGVLFRGTLAQTPGEQLLGRILRAAEPGRVYHLVSPLGLRFALYRPDRAGKLLLLGPCREEGGNEKAAAAWLRRAGLEGGDLQALLAYCRQQPAVSYDRLYNLCQLLARHLSGPDYPLSQEELSLTEEDGREMDLLQRADFEELSHIRGIEGRYEASAVMTEAVKRGNLALAYRYIQKMGELPQDLVRTENSLRNAQNLCIIMNTQLRYALEVDGVHPYRLNQVSGTIARHIEELKTQGAVNNYFAQILRQYCELAQEQHQRELPPFSRLAVAYIHTHLSDTLTVKDAARDLLVNADYLSNRFCREVGMPFIAYVNRERCIQAAGLLRRTHLQVQQVALAVGYNNTSYFARQFGKVYGMTPRDWRHTKE